MSMEKIANNINIGVKGSLGRSVDRSQLGCMSCVCVLVQVHSMVIYVVYYVLIVFLRNITLSG